MPRPKRKPPPGAAAVAPTVEPDKSDAPVITVNERYARDFERRARHRELQRAKDAGITPLSPSPSSSDSGDDERNSDGASSSESAESEDEHAELLTKRIDKRIRDTLHAIQNRDGSIYDPTVNFFGDVRGDSESSAGADDDGDGEASEGDEPVAGWDAVQPSAARSPLTIKSYVRERILRKADGGDVVDSGSDSDEHEDDGGRASAQRAQKQPDALAYDDDQERLREQLRRSVHEGGATVGSERSTEADAEAEANDDGGGGGDDDDDDDGDGTFFRRKEKSELELAEEDADYRSFAQQRLQRGGGAAAGDELLLHSYLQQESRDEKERFLRDFVLNNGWLGAASASAASAAAGDGAELLNDDEAFLEQQDEVERRHNFRFEEGDESTRVQTYSRTVPGSLRRPEERRRLARERRAQRKREERRLRESERAQLRAARSAELSERLQLLRRTSGGVDFDDVDLEKDFDAEEFSRRMEAKFGDEFYEQPEADETDAPSADGRGDSPPTGRKSKRKRPRHPFEDDPEVQREIAEMAAESGGGTEISGEERADAAVAAQAKRVVRQLQKEAANGDAAAAAAGGARTFDAGRFAYREVEADSFGLAPADMLEWEDKELNRRLPLKYLAPYRSKRPRVRRQWSVHDRRKTNHDRTEERRAGGKEGSGMHRGAGGRTKAHRTSKKDKLHLSDARAKAYSLR